MCQIYWHPRWKRNFIRWNTSVPRVHISTSHLYSFGKIITFDMFYVYTICSSYIWQNCLNYICYRELRRNPNEFTHHENTMQHPSIDQKMLTFPSRRMKEVERTQRKRQRPAFAWLTDSMISNHPTVCYLLLCLCSRCLNFIILIISIDVTENWIWTDKNFRIKVKTIND